MKELMDRQEDLNSIREIAQDIIDSASEIESMVISYTTFNRETYSFDIGSIPTNVGMLELQKREIITRWELPDR